MCKRSSIFRSTKKRKLEESNVNVGGTFKKPGGKVKDFTGKLWSDVYTPKNTEQLAVNPKKVCNFLSPLTVYFFI